MWEDYAKARGLSTASLTQAQKIEAEYLGIMQETAAQMGDLEKLSGGLAGAQAEAATQSTLLAQAFGVAMTPMVQTGTEALTGALEMLTGITEAAPEAAAGVTAFAGALTGLIAMKSLFSTLKSLFSALSITRPTVLALAGVAAAVGLVTAAISGYRRAQEEAAAAEEERLAAIEADVQAQRAALVRLGEIKTRYEELSQKQVLTIEESQEMAGLRQELAEAFGAEAAAVRDTAAAYGELTAAMIEQAEQQTLEDLYSAQNAQTVEAMNAARQKYDELAKSVYAAHQMLNDVTATEGLDAPIKSVEELNTVYALLLADLQKTTGSIPQQADEMLTHLKNVFAETTEAGGEISYRDAFAAMTSRMRTSMADELEGVYRPWLQSHVAQYSTEAILKGAEGIPDSVGESFAKIVSDRLGMVDMQSLFGRGGEELFDIGISEASNSAREMMQDFVAAYNNPDVTAGLNEINTLINRANEGVRVSQTEAEGLKSAWEAVFGEGSALTGFFEDYANVLQGSMGEEGYQKVAEGWVAMLTGLGEMGRSAESAEAILNATADAAWAAGGAAEEAFDMAGASTEDANTQARKLLREYEDLSGEITDMNAATARLERGQGALNKALASGARNLSEVADLTDDDRAALADLGKAVGYTGDDIATLAARAGDFATELAIGLDEAIADLDALQSSLAVAAGRADIDAEVRVQTEGAISSINALIIVARAALAILSALGMADGSAASTGGGGGGGGSRKDKEEEARKAAEQARKEAIERDYEHIAHRRHMNEITLEEELALLEAIRRNHRLTAEEIMEWEEKVYDLRQEIRQRDADSLDNLADGVLSALENRYQAMLDKELERLDESREAWETWRDESVQAIEDQIAALDKLADTEDREARDAEELRKIARLQQSVEFEQDAYNRAKLQQQLDEAIRNREERLRALELEDQKEALRAQIEAVEAQAQSGLDALDEEQAAIEKAYEERMRAAALQAEAERMLLETSQRELLSLLADYAPEYNATGETLGEKLAEGFQSAVGGIADWFEAFNAQVLAVQGQLAAASLAATDAFYEQQQARAATVVHQTVNFNQPVETPGQAAKRLEEANEALADEIAGWM